MSTKTTTCCALLIFVLTACQGGGADQDEAQPEPEASSPAPEERKADFPEGVDPSDIVWADEAFLNDAGVKEGKDVIYLPTPPMVVDKMIEMAGISAGDLVYDLGTGDGRIAIAAAKQTGCKAVGFEIDEELVARARENVRNSGVEHLVTIEKKDILDLDFSEVDVVLMYLNQELNVALIPQLQALKPGARVVSHDWGMSGRLEPSRVVENFQSREPDFINLHNIYLWEAPIEPP